jgi:integrase
MPQTIDIMILSLSANSLKQYNCALYKWWQYCKDNKLDYLSVNTSLVLNFLTEQYQRGASYSSLNTCRSALSLISGKPLSEDKHVSRFLKGVYKTKPVFPKYQTTWNPNIVLDHLTTLYPNESISLDLLTRKTVTLLALSTAQRVQTLSLIKVDNIQINEGNIRIIIDDLIKTSAPGKPTPRLILPFFPNKEEICPARTLLAYIDRTQTFRSIRNAERLLLTIKRPIHNASSSTISRWIKQTLSDSGIDTNMYCAHSTRHAATSAANRKGLSVEMIKKTAGWSGNSLVFSKFYNRPLSIENNADNAFAEAVYNV